MERQFLSEIGAGSLEDSARLIYTDWLEEQGDPLGEFIRLVLGEETGPAWMGRFRALFQQLHSDRRLPLVFAWCEGPFAVFESGWITEIVSPATLSRSRQRLTFRCIPHRGMPDWTAGVEEIELCCEESRWSCRGAVQSVEKRRGHSVVEIAVLRADEVIWDVS